MYSAHSVYNFESGLSLRKKSAEEIEAAQLAFLKEHLLYAEKVPYYKNIFEQTGINGCNLRSFEEFARLPLTSREDIDANVELFSISQEEEYRDYALTSGTTGEPVIVPYTASDLHRLAYNEAMAFYGTGVRKKDKVLLTVTLDRCFVAGLAYYSGVVFLGATAIRSGPGQAARQWSLIEQLKPEVLVGVPTFLKSVGIWAREKGYSPEKSTVKRIVTIGEPVRKGDHALSVLGQDLQNLWHADLFSSYGATEFETAFCECRSLQGGHVHPELMVVEVVDDQGQPVPDGQAGEVVVTPLGVEGFPLIRLRTGDIARLHGGPCSCGWNSKRLGPVEGRLAQRLKYRGTTFYPETVFHALQHILDVDCAYVEVYSTDVDTDDVTVVVGCSEHQRDVEEIEKQLQAHLRVKPRVVLKPSQEVHDAMHKDGGRKAKKFFDYRDVSGTGS